jgi:hypothetical protein
VLSRDGTKVFLVDFGLAKKHIGKDGRPIPARRKADFRGTVSFASLNAHYCIVSGFDVFISCVGFGKKR